MPRIQSIGKFLDQPLLTAKIYKQVPYVLAGTMGAMYVSQIANTPNGEKKKRALNLGIILSATAASAIYAPKLAGGITKRQLPKGVFEIVKENTEIVDKYLSEHNVPDVINNILQKAKTKRLSLKEVNLLFADKKNSKIANALIPPPDNITSKDIFKEIKYLSLYGAIPVAGGIAGGVTADMLTENDWKTRVPNKIKEGAYQYLANIFLCNVGAGAALGVLEKLGIQSKAARVIGMIGGIIATGVVGGSLIANYIGNKFINPLISKNNKKDIRTPEIVDLSLHSDDIATVSLLSGLKWIEPSLPLLYSVSGYRAGIGYRNDKHSKKNE